MNPTYVPFVLLGLVAVSTLVGLIWRSQQGRVSHARRRRLVQIGDVPGMRSFARGATLLQFSTEVCAPCAVTRTVLKGVASEHQNVAHVELDVTHRPDLANRFHIMQTPTTLILDRQGVIRARIGGAPRRDSIRAELDRIIVTS